jgi:hypothetical protein
VKLIELDDFLKLSFELFDLVYVLALVFQGLCGVCDGHISVCLGCHQLLLQLTDLGLKGGNSCLQLSTIKFQITLVGR